MNNSSLYDKIGGASGVESLVLDFYAKVLKDPTLAPFFRDTSFEKLYTMQQEFFTMALGGPSDYSGKSLAAAHHGRDIKPEHIGLFVNHLLATLKEKGIDNTEAHTVIERVNRHANEVVGTSY